MNCPWEVGGRMTKILTFKVGQSCRSTLNSRAAQQRRPTGCSKIFCAARID